ncbi:MAG: hypothetical protein IJH55_05685 [Romboutsia sp.]|nr:hypothetical protein [Romboutsia sp.]
MEKSKLSTRDKQIIREDIEGLKYLIKLYQQEGKLDKAAQCETELEELKRKLKG